MTTDVIRLLTPREFAQRVRLSLPRVGELLRGGAICGAQQLASGRWRIPAEAVDRFLAGERPELTTTATTTVEVGRRLWRRYGKGRVPAWLKNG